jgi:hypothetical protein
VGFVAELNETAGRVSVRRKVVVATGESALVFPGAPDLPEELQVKPPLPFTGSAEFLRTPESAYTWSGDLAVTFPGLDPIRLTGPRFSAVVCSAKGCLLHATEDSPARHRK